MNGTQVGRSLAVMLLLVLMVAAAQAWAAAPAWAEGEVQVRLTPERSELTVGDPLQLTLEVTHPAGTQVIIPKLGPEWGNFEVRSQSPATTEANDDGTVTTRQMVEVSLFDLGEFETPPWAVTVSDGAGQVFEESIPSVALTVVPTLDPEDNELRDIKPQAGLAVPAAWPWIAGGVLLAVALAGAGWWAYRRWRGQPFLAPALDARPPWQVAYDELARIEGLDLLEQGRFKEYYTLITDCQRTYLEQQFGLRVFDRTTSELRVIFRGSDLVPEHGRRFLELFAASDLVKFAKFRPSVETARALLGEARDLVALTRNEAMARANQQAANRQAAAPQPGDEVSELEEFFKGQSVSEDGAPVLADGGPVSAATASRLGYQPGR